MPALPPVPGVIKFVAEGSQNAGRWANVFHWTYTGPAPDEIQLNTLATQFYVQWQSTSIPALMTVDTALEQVIATDLSTVMSPAVAVAAPAVGTNGEDPLPGSICGLTTYEISMRYRGGHPRTYWSIGGDGDLDTATPNMNQWGDAFVTSAQDKIGAFQTAIDGLTAGATALVSQAAVKYIKDKVPLLAPIVMTLGPPLFEKAIATQRRRIGR